MGSERVTRQAALGELSWKQLAEIAKANGVPVYGPGGKRGRVEVERDLAEKGLTAPEPVVPAVADPTTQSTWIRAGAGKRYQACQRTRDACEIVDADGNIVAIFYREGNVRGAGRVVLDMKRHVLKALEALNKE